MQSFGPLCNEREVPVSGKASLIVMSVALLLSACATQKGTVLPKGDGTYTVLTQAQNERDALRMAQRDAEYTCKKSTGRKHFVSLSHKSQDVGPEIASSKDGGVKGMAASVLQHAVRANNTENFKVEMLFRCGHA
jgi:hypothetical protein